MPEYIVGHYLYLSVIVGERYLHSVNRSSSFSTHRFKSCCRLPSISLPPLYRMAQNFQRQQLQALLDTCTYSMSVSVPAKTLKVCIVHCYNDLRKLAKPPISNSVELAGCTGTDLSTGQLDVRKLKHPHIRILTPMRSSLVIKLWAGSTDIGLCGRIAKAMKTAVQQKHSLPL